MNQKETGFKINIIGNNNSIDFSKNMTINKYQIIIQDSRINFEDKDSREHIRSKYENDRPRLEKYYKEGRKEIDFVGFVARNKNSKTVVVNLHDPQGKHLASHIIMNDDKLSGYVGKLIRFKGDIYPYKSVSYSDEKYGVNVIDDTIIELNINEHPYVSQTPWKENSKYIDITTKKFDKTINDFVNSSEDNKRSKLEDIKDYLNIISLSMFGVPNLIYSQILTIFSMKDNLDDVELNSYNLKHLNILLTIIAEYITGLRPDDYHKVLKIITYLTLVYLGYDILHPSDKNARNYLYETCKHFKINEEHINYSIKDYMRNAGGYKAVEEYIPKHLRFDMFELPKVARTLFVYRLLDS